MIVSGIKVREGSLQKLKNLLEDDSRKIHGVYYTNSFFSQRYLSRAYPSINELDIEGNRVKLTIVTRLEQVGLMEAENTLDMLVKYKAGDIPGFTPESIFTDQENQDAPHIVEPVSLNQYLVSLDFLLDMKDPEITYQDFKIAGSQFTLVNIRQVLEEEFEQTVTLLFGEADRMYLFSHFYKKPMNLRDKRLLFDLIIDENITGKAITAVYYETEAGTVTSLLPLESMIGSYTNTSGDIIFNTASSFIKLPKNALENYKLTCDPINQGSYVINLSNKKEALSVYFE